MKIKKNTPEEAFEAYEEVRKYRHLSTYSFLQLGKTLLKIQREKLYKQLDHTSYASFLSDPDVAIPKATAYLYAQVYKFYVETHHVEEDDLVDVELSRLRDLMPILEEGMDIGLWLSKAKTLSRKDFINEVREAKGLEPMSEMDGPVKAEEEEPIDVSYVDLVKASSCIICGKTPVDPHHFPQTKATTDDDRKVIPLCRECHTKAHNSGVETFFNKYRNLIMTWFYGLVLPPKDGDGV